MAAVGTESGQQVIDGTVTWCGGQPLPWQEYHGGFETLVAGTAPVFWCFFLLTGISVFVLRLKDRDRYRPFATPLFPLPPLVFCAACSFMLYASVTYAKGLCLIGLAPLALGLPVYWLGCVSRSSR
jgi:amino acid transporter